MKKDITKTEENLPAIAQAAGGLIDLGEFGEFAGAGLENVEQGDLKMPMLSILQALSPDVVDQTIQGAKPGLIKNSINSELSEDALVVPCYFDKQYSKYELKSDGTVNKEKRVGPATAEDFISAAKNSFGVAVKNGQAITQSHLHYCLVIDAHGNSSRALIPMRFTSLKHSKTWLTQMQFAKGISNGKTVTLPIFMNTYSLLPLKEEYEGKKYYVWSVTSSRPTEAKYLQEAVAYHKDARALSIQLQAKGDVAEAAETKIL